ncbi:hypothetical protein AB5I41_23575 [Sphingomonas sp. MMS24-JH45]
MTEYRYDARDRLAHTVVYRNAIGATKLALVADPGEQPGHHRDPAEHRCGRPARLDRLRRRRPGPATVRRHRQHRRQRL